MSWWNCTNLNGRDVDEKYVFLLDVGKNNNAYEVILNPGDILIVPSNWWHYVENLETSLTVNTWIPLVSGKKITHAI